MSTSRALFLSPILPADFLVRGSGVHQRFKLMIEAIRQLVDEIDFVIMVDAWRTRSLETPTRESIDILSRLVDVPISVTLVPIEPPATNLGLFDRYFSSSTSFFRLPDYRPYLGIRQIAALRSALERQPDLIFSHRLVSTALLLRAIGPRPHAPVFVDLDDIEHIAYRRTIEQPPMWASKRLGYLHLPALMVGEYRALRLSRKLFVCSESDRDRLRRLFRSTKIEAIPNAVELPESQPLSQAPQILLLGVYSYAPNRVAAEFFLDAVWPTIRASVPHARAVLAGASPEAIRHSRHPPAGVEFPGFVPDLDALYKATRLVVSPILAGGGTRVKIIEAAAYGKPVVATPLGAEGLEFRDGQDILLRSDATSFAAACIHLLEDYDACVRLGDAARLRVETAYNRGDIATRLAASIRACLR